MPTPELLVCDLGLVEYRDGLALQERLRTARQADEHGDLLLLLEHPPVYTRGRRSQPRERPLVAALAEAGLDAHARTDEGPDYTGVWVDDRKIASIGVHVARGVSTHGFAVNVENDLQPFEWIVPCGLEGVRMTSVIAERHDPTAGAL